MFITNFKEQQQSQIKLEGISPELFDIVLTFVYTSRIEITVDNLADLLATASYLQFHEVVSLCEEFMVDLWLPDRCIEYLQLTISYNLKTCKTKIEALVLAHFADVSKTADFLKYDIDALTKLLASDQLSVETEMEVFDIVLNWISSQSDKVTAGKKVLPHIRYGLIPSEKMDLICRTVRYMVGDACNDILQEATDYHAAPTVCSSGSVIGTIRCALV